MAATAGWGGTARTDTGGDARTDTGTGTGGERRAPGRLRRTTAVAAAAACGALALTAAGVAPAAAHPAGHHAPGHAPGHGHGHDNGHGHGHGRPGVDYVALGDSYTAGPAIPDQVDADCARSDRNYPSLLAARNHYASFTDVSCSGATTAQMWQAQGSNPPQLDAVHRGTDLVTVQIGGNDIGFGSIIATCAGLSTTAPAGSPCEDHYGASGHDQLAATIAGAAPKIAQVLRAVHRKAPHARVVLVGYPDLLPDEGPGCFPAVPFAAGDVPYLRDTEKRLNAMLRREALRGGATYVDTYGPTVGHDMCEPEADRWIEPLAPEAPAAPAHPNARGEQAMAAAVAARIGTPGHRR